MKRFARASVCPRLENLEDRTLLSGNTYVVNALGDAGVGTVTATGGSGDIRFCISQADLPQNAGSTITFDSTVFPSTKNTTINLSHGELPIADNMIITGPGASALTISGGNGSGAASRIFDITSSQAVVTISGLTISGGNGSPSVSVTPGNQGGDLFNGGNLTLTNDVVKNGFVLGVVGGPPARGGGIFNAEGQNGQTGATLTLNNTVVENNEAKGATGANSVYFGVSGNPGGYGAGGGIYNDANAVLNIQNGSQILNNTALGGNGGNGLHGLNGQNANANGQPGFSGGTGGSGGAGGAAMGGGIYNNSGGVLSITGSNATSVILADNVAQGGSGGNGDYGGNGGNGKSLGSGGKGGNGGNGGNGGSSLGGGVYSSGSVLSLQFAQFKGNQARGGMGGTASHAGNGGNGGSKGAGGFGGFGGFGGSGGSAGGGGIYNNSPSTSTGAPGSLTILNSQFTTDASGVGNQAVGGTGNAGGAGGNAGNAGGKFLAGGRGGSGGAGGNGGVALGGAVLNAGGNVSFSTVTTTAALARGGNGGSGGGGAVGGTGGAARFHLFGNTKPTPAVGGVGGAGGAGGVGGAAQGGGVYNIGGSLSFSNYISNKSQAVGGAGNAGGSGGTGGVGGNGGGNSSSRSGGSGGVGGSGGAGGVGGAAQGGGFYNGGGALTLGGSQFTSDSVTSGSGGAGGGGGTGGKAGNATAKNGNGGRGGNGGTAGAGGSAGVAEGGGGSNAGGNVSITGSTFRSNLVQAGNGANGGNGGFGGNGGDRNGNGFSGAGGSGASGGAGGSASTAQGGGLSVTAGTLDISNSTFGGSAALANQVLGGSGGSGGIGGTDGLFGAPTHAYPVFQPPTTSAGNAGKGGAGTTVSGGGLAVSSGAPPANVNILSSFPGIDENNSSILTEPPDTQGAVGPSNYIETVNQAIAIYNKSTGATIAADSLSDFFFSRGGLAHVSKNDFQGDSFITFDPLADNGQGCFIVGDLEAAVDPTTGQPGGTNGDANALLLAVSKTNNPTTLGSADWYFYEVNTTLSTVALQDYPGNIGYNADALVITQNSFSSTADVGTFVNAISISALTSGKPLTLGTNLFQNEYTPSQLPLLPRPVTMTDAQPGGPMWFVASAGAGGTAITGAANTINVLEMTNVLSANPTFTTTTLAVNPYYENQPPLQPDGSQIFNAIDSRILNADESKGLIVADQNVSDAAGDEDNARWYEIDVSSGTPKLVQEGDVSGGPGVYDIVPSIAINAAGAIGMTFMQTGTASGQFLSMYVTGRLPTDPLGTMEVPLLVQAGAGSVDYNGVRDGDMAGINVDPTDGSFWAANEFATPQQFYNWGTAIAHFTVTASPPPSRTVTISDSSFDDNVLKGGAGGSGGAGGLIPTLNLSVLPFIPIGGNSGAGGAGGNASGGGIALSVSSAQNATLSNVNVSGNSASGGVGGQGGIQDRANSGAGGNGGSVKGGGIASVNYNLTVAPSKTSTSQINNNISTAGSGGAGGTNSLTAPDTAAGGNGGAGGSVLGGGILFENDTQTTLTFTVNGASVLNNQLTAAAGGAGGAAGTWGHDHILGGSGGSGGQALGGGLYVFASGSAVNTSSLNGVTLTGNLATAGNGGLGGAGASAITGLAAGQFAAGGNGGDAQGGGLYNNSLNTTASTLSITASTIAGNQLTAGTGNNAGTGTTANGGPGGNGGNGGNADGGGVFNGNNTTLTVLNSTFGGGSLNSKQPTANSNTLTAGSGGNGGNAGTPQGVTVANGGNGGAGGSAAGGNIYNSSPNATFLDDTLVYGQAVTFGLGGTAGSGAGSGGKSGTAGAGGTGTAGGYFAAAGSSNIIGNTILALNNAATDADAAGNFTSDGHNLLTSIAGTGTSFTTTGTDQVVTAAQLNLGSLQNNGGPTLTDALLPGSVAIDDGNNALVPSTLTTDQRGTGFARIANGLVDIGAFEFQPPVITTLSPNTIIQGSPPFTLTITGTNFATGATVSFGSTMLTPLTVSNTQITVTVPAMLLLNSGTVSVTVDNPDGSGLSGHTVASNAATFTISPTPFGLNNPGSQSNNAGDPVSLSITPISGFSASNFTATGLPPGLSINTNTGVISGTIAYTGAGTYSVTVNAYETGTTINASVSFTWVVNPPAALVNPGNQSSDEGDTVSLAITTTTGTPISGYSATGLPPGLSINAATGVISGTIDPRGAGTYSVTVTPAHSGGAGGVTFTWKVADTTRPVLTNPGLQANNAGDAVSLAIQAVDADPGSFTATGLPPGLSINANTGVISGTIAANASGNYSVMVQASDGGLLSSPMIFLWSVSPLSSGSGSGPGSSGSGTTGVPPGLSGLATQCTIVSVTNQYPGFVQLETVTVDVTNPNGYAVNEGVVAIQVDGQTVYAPVSNGVATATVATSLFDFGLLMDLLFAHPLTVNYGDSTGVFAPSGAGTTLTAIWLDFLFFEFAEQLQQLTQLQLA